MKPSSILIGIGGVSRSGKTTLARQLQKHYAEQDVSCLILSQDDYVIPEHLIPKIRDRIDWEDPISIDWKRLKAKIEQMKSQFQVIIVEGLFAFVDHSLTAQYDMKFFMEIRKETFLARKAVDNRWGPEPDWFIEHIWESFLRYGRVDISDSSFVVFNGEKVISIPQLL